MRTCFLMAWATLGKVFFSRDLPTDFLGLLPFLDDCFVFVRFMHGRGETPDRSGSVVEVWSTRGGNEKRIDSFSHLDYRRARGNELNHCPGARSGRKRRPSQSRICGARSAFCVP